MRAACSLWMLVLCAVVGVPRTAQADAAEEAMRVADIAAQYRAGDYAKAADQARKFLGSARDPDSITEARRVLAESLRKQGLWRPAAGAYTALARACEKGSEEALRHEAIGDVLASNVNGVYKPALADGEKRKLSDDDALKAALVKWAAFRCGRFKSHCARLIRARTPHAVVAVVKPAAEEARGIFVVAPEVTPDGPREFAKEAGAKLAQIHGGVAATLRGKLSRYNKKMEVPWSFTNVEKQDIKKTSDLCKQMAQAEEVFQECLADLVGNGEWAEADTLRSESSERQSVYNQFATQYVVPAYDIDYIF